MNRLLCWLGFHKKLKDYVSTSEDGTFRVVVLCKGCGRELPDRRRK